MDGNSLGLCSRDAEATLMDLLHVWKEQGIKLWNIEDGRYFQYSRVLAKLTAYLISALPEEICITGSTTVNIHQAISTFYKPSQ